MTELMSFGFLQLFCITFMRISNPTPCTIIFYPPPIPPYRPMQSTSYSLGYCNFKPTCIAFLILHRSYCRLVGVRNHERIQDLFFSQTQNRFQRVILIPVFLIIFKLNGKKNKREIETVPLSRSACT